MTKTYYQTLNHIVENAPDLLKPTEFIRWAEDMAELLSFIYPVDYVTVTEDIVEKAKEVQDYEDSEDSED